MRTGFTWFGVRSCSDCRERGPIEDGKSEIRGLHEGVVENSVPLVCNCFTSEDESMTFLRTIRNHSPLDTAPYPRGRES